MYKLISCLDAATTVKGRKYRPKLTHQDSKYRLTVSDGRIIRALNAACTSPKT